MIKHLSRHGNSYALVIDRGVLDLLKIEPDTPLSVSTDGHCLLITPVRDDKRGSAFRAAAEKVARRYGKAFKRLAE
ncbi:MAG: AbrB/MazE/SpoVT family DNA-binding domain-containing protein [Planctomycetes bacterium]|nr:AbrB/MazE/SpoVT family DNA-binding domain-containing protein [Planctomycetota bacterium]